MATELERSVRSEKLHSWINRLTLRGVAGWSELGGQDPIQSGQRIRVHRNDIIETFVALQPECQMDHDFFANLTELVEVDSELWEVERRKGRGA